MGYRCCCCCSVTVGSRIWAGFTIFAAFFALLGDFWSLEEWYLWVTSSIILVVELIAGIMVFMAVRRKQPKLMIPILAITVLQLIFLIVYFGFALWAIFDNYSPIAQNIREKYNDLEWFRDLLDGFWFTSVDDYITYFSITLSISIFIAIIINVWIFVTHRQTYRLITQRLLHSHPIIGVPAVHIVPASYPPSIFPGPSPTVQQLQPQQQGAPPPYITAAPAEALPYPSLTTYSGQGAYSFDPALGKEEHVKF